MQVACSLAHIAVDADTKLATAANIRTNVKAITDSSRVQVSGTGGNTIARYSKTNSFNNNFVLQQTTINN